jgi:hypothetical protein
VRHHFGKRVLDGNECKAENDNTKQEFTTRGIVNDNYGLPQLLICISSLLLPRLKSAEFEVIMYFSHGVYQVKVGVY